jgi:soluble lytic murein transglycosylase-like protein
MRKNLLLIGSLVAASLAAAVPADAQIYSWRDDAGTLVLSNKPREGTAPVLSYAVPKTDAVRVTRSAPASQGRLFDEVIVEHSKMHNIRPDLVRAVVQVESAFNPYAVSPKGAQGLMQLMPATARALGVSNPFNPLDNIRGGVRYLRQLLDRYDNDEVLALAAYNAGPEAVAKYGQKVPPYRETRNYVTKVNEIAGAPSKPAPQIYRGADVTTDGRVIPKYTDKKPQ